VAIVAIVVIVVSVVTTTRSIAGILSMTGVAVAIVAGIPLETGGGGSYGRVRN
jgi:H+/gluconate symporter-like permease